MANNTSEIGLFIFGINVLQDEDGKIESQNQTLNKNVPPEIVILQLKALLKDMQKQYFGSDN